MSLALHFHRPADRRRRDKRLPGPDRRLAAEDRRRSGLRYVWLHAPFAVHIIALAAPDARPTKNDYPTPGPGHEGSAPGLIA
jgi:hypothetical protein